MPGGIAIAAILGGGHAAIYALLLAGGSAAILLPVIEELGLLGDERILVVMAQVAVADVSAIVALPLVMQPSKAGRAALGGLAVAAAALALFGLAYLLRNHPAIHRIRKESKKQIWALDLRLALLSLFVLAWIAVRSGTSILIAGFAVGLVVAVIGGPKRLSTQVTGIASGFFVPLFFVTLGAKLDLRAVVEKPSILELTALLVVANVAVHIVGALLTRQQLPAALAATAQLGLPAGVVTLGLQEHVISSAQGGAILIAALVTIGLCPAGIALLTRTEDDGRRRATGTRAAVNIVDATASYETLAAQAAQPRARRRPCPEAQADGGSSVPVPACDVLLLARSPLRALPRRPRRCAGGGRDRRPARRELRLLARSRGASRLGRQRFRRGRGAAVHLRPAAPRRRARCSPCARGTCRWPSAR